MHQFHVVTPRRARRWISLLAASAAACSILAGPAAPAHAAVSPIPADTPMKLKFKHSGLVANIEGASTQSGAHLIQWHDVNGFDNDDFLFIKVGGVGPPDRYVIKPVRQPAGGQVYLIPSTSGQGAQVIQKSGPVHPGFAWRVVEGDDGHVNLLSATGLAMNVFNASTVAGASVITWPQVFGVFFNDDIKILPAT